MIVRVSPTSTFNVHYPPQDIRLATDVQDNRPARLVVGAVEIVALLERAVAGMWRIARRVWKVVSLGDVFSSYCTLLMVREDLLAARTHLP